MLQKVFRIRLRCRTKFECSCITSAVLDRAAQCSVFSVFEIHECADLVSDHFGRMDTANRVRVNIMAQFVPAHKVINLKFYTLDDHFTIPDEP